MTAEFVGPSLSCTSSSARMSGERRLSTIRPASSANFAGGSSGREILDVERGDRELGACLRACTSRCQPAVDARESGRELELEVAEVVVEHADRGRREAVADVRVGCRVQEDVVLELDPLGIEVGRADHDALADRADAGSRAVVGEHPELAEAVRRADDDGVVDAEEHRLEALVEVDPVGRRVEGAARLDVARGVVVDDARRRDAPAEADDRLGDRRAGPTGRDGRGDDLGRRQVRARRATRAELASRAR